MNCDVLLEVLTRWRDAILALIVIQKVILAFLGVYLRFCRLVVNVYLNVVLTGES